MEIDSTALAAAAALPTEDLDWLAKMALNRADYVAAVRYHAWRRRKMADWRVRRWPGEREFWAGSVITNTTSCKGYEVSSDATSPTAHDIVARRARGRR